MLEKGVIEPVLSPWASPAVFCSETGWDAAVLRGLSQEQCDNRQAHLLSHAWTSVFILFGSGPKSFLPNFLEFVNFPGN